jgi:hypothetical protein
VSRFRTCEGEEDVVERGTPDAQVRERDLLFLEPAAGRDQERGATPGRDADSPLVGVDVGGFAHDRCEQRSCALDIGGFLHACFEQVPA